METYHATYSRRKRQELKDWKETVPCADCGYKFPHYVMEFDHTQSDGNGKGFLERAWTVNGILEAMEREQVELVCSNCHKIRTHTRRQ